LGQRERYKRIFNTVRVIAGGIRFMDKLECRGGEVPRPLKPRQTFVAKWCVQH
jgi:hypothetical protein